MIKNLFVLVLVFGTFAYAEESPVQKIKDAAHETKNSVKENWKKTKPKIKSAFKDVKDGTKKAIKDLKSGG